MTTTWGERLAAALGTVAYVFVVMGVAVHALLAPAYTRALVVTLDVPAAVDLPAAEATALAEEVRAYVATSSGAALPSRLPDGRIGFDPDAVAHLDDVRDVIASAQLAALAAAVLALVWPVWAWRRESRRRLLARSLRAAAWALAVGIGAAILGMLFAFDAVFVGFHALFFEGDTWLFPADNLLILLFPEPFWAISGIACGVLTLAGAVLLGMGARRLTLGSSADGA